MTDAGEVFQYILDKQPGKHISIPVGDTKTKVWIDNNWFDNVADAREFVQENQGQYNAYFGITKYKHKRRRKTDAENSCFLYADLDTCRLEDIPKQIQPTIVIQTSEGRLQGLWEVDCALKPESYSRLNKLIAYGLAKFGADKSGWDVTQVLRVPGSLNHKYDTPMSVNVVKFEQQAYDTDKLTAYLEKTYAKNLPTVAVNDGFKLLYASLPQDVKRKLFLEKPNEFEDRSAALFWGASRLLESSFLPFQVLDILRRSDWNKFSGRDDEQMRLEELVERAMKPAVVSVGTLEVLSDQEMLRTPFVLPEWIVPGILQTKNLTFLAAEEKSFKSTIMLDLAHSLTSKLPFLGVFPVYKTGNVLFLSFEGDISILQLRLRKIKQFKTSNSYMNDKGGGYFTVQASPPNTMYFNDSRTLNLNIATPEGKAWVERAIDELEITTLVIDPLYMAIIGVDLLSGKEVMPHVAWLQSLITQAGLRDVIVIHHFNKSSSSKGNSVRMHGPSELLYAYGTFISIVNHSKELEAPKRPKKVVNEDGVTTAADFNIQTRDHAELSISASFRIGPPTTPIRFTLYPGFEDSPYRIIAAGGEVEPVSDEIGKLQQLANTRPNLSNKKLSEQSGLDITTVNRFIGTKT